MLKLESADLPDGWTVGRSPLAPKASAGLDAVLSPTHLPDAWHEVLMSDGTQVLLRIVEEGDYPPAVDSVVVSPGQDPFATGVDGKTLREVRIERIEQALASRWAAETLVGALRARLGDRAYKPLRPPDRSDPDAFSAHVAFRYLSLIGQTPNPTKAIADETGVMHEAAQRWVVEARRRGHLPPATRRRGGTR